MFVLWTMCLWLQYINIQECIQLVFVLLLYLHLHHGLCGSHSTSAGLCAVWNTLVIPTGQECHDGRLWVCWLGSVGYQEFCVCAYCVSTCIILCVHFGRAWQMTEYVASLQGYTNCFQTALFMCRGPFVYNQYSQTGIITPCVSHALCL